MVLTLRTSLMRRQAQKKIVCSTHSFTLVVPHALLTGKAKHADQYQLRISQ